MKSHCDGGAWVAGKWIPSEDCAKTFLCQNQKTSGQQYAELLKNCKNCTQGKSRSKISAAKPDGSYDIAIIGAGCIGANVARELSKTTASVILLEAADDVTQGATKGNSGIVHAGYDDKPGSMRSKFCPKGCRMFPQLDEELHFGFQQNGSLVVGKGKEDEATLERLLQQGKTNGVKNLRIVDQAELKGMEPELHPSATAALLASDAGTIIPYEFCIAVAENAVDNGVELRLRSEVMGITKDAASGNFDLTVQHWEPSPPHGSGSGSFLILLISLVAGAISGYAAYALTKNASITGLISAVITVGLYVTIGGKRTIDSRAKDQYTYTPSPGTTFRGTCHTETVRAKYVINCAGCYSDKIAKLVGDNSFEVNQRYGDYVLLHKKEGKRCAHILFPCPGPMGKGVLVQNTLWGNLILGPTARDSKRKDEKTGQLVVNEATRDEKPESILRAILGKCKELVPSFDASEVIHTFCGARAKTTKGDWIIERCVTQPNLIHAAGIDSPGLAGSPAIALEVIRLLGEAGAPIHTPNPTFNPIRAPLVIPKKGMKTCLGHSMKFAPVGQVTDPYMNVLCKCEKVVEAEVIEACHRSIPIDNTQAIRRRTRCGMGHCQGDPCNYDCEARVASIIARETGLDAYDVQKRPWPASSVMPKRWFGEKEKKWVAHQAE